MKLLHIMFIATALVLAVPVLAQEDEEDDGILRPPAEEYRTATLLADQGKYQSAVKHFRNIKRIFEEEDPKTREERFYLAVAEVHLAAYELKRALDEGQFTKEQREACKEWIEALFPSTPRAAGEMLGGSGRVVTVSTFQDVRKAVKDEALSGMIVDNSRGALNQGAVQQLIKWVQDGHKAVVQDATANAFGFTALPVPAIQNPRITRGRRATEEILLAGVQPDTLAFVRGNNRGWCVTGHPTAKPLLTVTLPAPRGARRPGATLVLCAVAKVGRGEVIFCTAGLDTRTGDGAKLYNNLRGYLKSLPGADRKADAAP